MYFKSLILTIAAINPIIVMQYIMISVIVISMIAIGAYSCLSARTKYMIKEMMVKTMTRTPANIPLFTLEQSTDKCALLFVGAGVLWGGRLELRRLLSIVWMLLIFFHISKRITAQISEYSMVQGKRN